MAMQPPGPSQGSPFVPLLIALIALVVFEGAQTIMMIRDRENLGAARDGQSAALQESDRMRQQLDAVAGKTAALAESGDADAKLIVTEFAKRGVNMVPPKEPPPESTK